MSYKYSFADNGIYSADDVNKITKRLVTSGVEDSFENGVAYNVSRFNEAGKLLYTSGVVPESCLTLKVVQAGDGTVIINPGLAFFDDGSVIEVEEGGEELAYVVGAMNYVYLKNDLQNANASYPCCSTQEPEGDYVMLAIIDEKGVVEDKRRFAHGKLPGYQSVTDAPLFVKETVELVLLDRHVAEGTASFDIGGNNFKYIISIGKMGHHKERESLSVYSIADGKIASLVRKGETEAFYEEDDMYFYYDRARSRIRAIPTIVDGVLNMKIGYINYDENLGEIGESVNVDVEFILV